MNPMNAEQQAQQPPGVVRTDGSVKLPEYLRDALGVAAGDTIWFDERNGALRLLTTDESEPIGTRGATSVAPDGTVRLPEFVRQALDVSAGEFVYFVKDVAGFRIISSAEMQDALGGADRLGDAPARMSPDVLGEMAFEGGAMLEDNPFDEGTQDARGWTAGWDKTAFRAAIEHPDPAPNRAAALALGQAAAETYALGMDHPRSANPYPALSPEWSAWDMGWCGRAEERGLPEDDTVGELAARALALCAAWYGELRCASERRKASRAWAEADRWSAFTKVFRAVARNPTARGYADALAANVPSHGART